MTTDTLTQAHITPAYGALENGMLIRRGRRAFCPMCGYLSGVASYRAAQGRVTRHRKVCRAD